MWLTFLASVGCTIPLTCLGWYCSDRKPGTPQDADFWFLIQTCVMQILGLFTVAIPIWRGKTPTKLAGFFTWTSIGIGVLFSSCAPYLYTKIPTPWAVSLTVLSGAVQAVVTLQVALAAEAHVGEKKKTK